MVEEKIETKVEEKKEKVVVENKNGTRMNTDDTDSKKVEKEKEVKAEKKKEVKVKEISKKDVAVANGFSLRVSPKWCIYICRIIRGKSPEQAVDRLQAVIDERRAVPMSGLEVGHKKGKGMSGGRFPKNACKAVMEIVKQAGANAVVAGIDEPVISIAKADRASAPFRRAGRKAKRTHLHVEIRSKTSPESCVVSRGKRRGGKK